MCSNKKLSNIFFVLHSSCTLARQTIGDSSKKRSDKVLVSVGGGGGGGDLVV